MNGSPHPFIVKVSIFWISGDGGGELVRGISALQGGGGKWNRLGLMIQRLDMYRRQFSEQLSHNISSGCIPLIVNDE